MNFVNVSNAIMATTRSRVLPVGINFFVWLLLNSLTEKVYETSKHVSEQHRRSSIIVAFASGYSITHWQMLIKSVIGAYMQTLRRFLSVLQESFISINFILPASTIAKLYRCRWQAELFFKWIKQHLRIKAFYGTTENAVKTQIWIAISVYVLVAIVKKRLNLNHSLYIILQILSVMLLEKIRLLRAFSFIDDEDLHSGSCNQLHLFR